MAVDWWTTDASILKILRPGNRTSISTTGVVCYLVQSGGICGPPNHPKEILHPYKLTPATTIHHPAGLPQSIARLINHNQYKQTQSHRTIIFSPSLPDWYSFTPRWLPPNTGTIFYAPSDSVRKLEVGASSKQRQDSHKPPTLNVYRGTVRTNP